MIRRPPRSTPKPSSAASDVYKRQGREDTPVSVIIHPPTRPPDSNSMNAHKHDAYSISIEGLRASQLPESTSMEEQTTTITTIELALDLVFVATNAHLRVVTAVMSRHHHMKHFVQEPLNTTASSRSSYDTTPPSTYRHPVRVTGSPWQRMARRSCNTGHPRRQKRRGCSENRCILQRI